MRAADHPRISTLAADRTHIGILLHPVLGEDGPCTRSESSRSRKRFPCTRPCISCFCLRCPAAASSQARIVNATIDTSKTGAPISKNIYGQFLEHGGDIVNTGVWSEMLVDRKFFYPVAASRAHATSGDGQCGGESAFPPHAHALVGSRRRRRRRHDGHQVALHRRSIAARQARRQRTARLQPVRNRGSQRQGLHRTHCAGRLSGRGRQGHAHLGQGSCRSPDRHYSHARHRVPQVPAALHRRCRHR